MNKDWVPDVPPEGYSTLAEAAPERAPAAVHIRPLDRERDMAIVGDSFQVSLRDCWPWRLMSARRLIDELRRHLAEPGCRALVATSSADDDGQVHGWCAVAPERNEVVFAYVRYSMRRLGTETRLGIGTTLLLAASIDQGRAVPVRFWTRATQRMGQRRGWSMLAPMVMEPED